MFIIFSYDDIIYILPMDRLKIMIKANGRIDIEFFSENKFANTFIDALILDITENKMDILKYVLPKEWKARVNQKPENLGFAYTKNYTTDLKKEI